MLESKEKNYKGNYSIKPDGDKRPYDVHETGTLIYYDIYKQLGEKSIISLLKTFDGVQVKDTAHYLDVLFEKDATLFQILSLRLRLNEV